MSNKDIIQDNKSGMRYRHDLLNWRYDDLERNSGFSMEQWARLAAGHIDKAKFSGPTIRRIREGQNVSIDILRAAALAIDINPEFLLKNESFRFRRAVLN